MSHAIHRVERFEIVGPYTLELRFADGSQQRIQVPRKSHHDGSAVGDDPKHRASNGGLTRTWTRRREQNVRRGSVRMR
jgi:hypothetical protein